MPPLSPDESFATEVVERLRACGHQAYWAGGCVRDRLLGRPAEDFDIATSARPEEVKEIFGPRRTFAVGAAFGVMIVRSHQKGIQVEVATFRTDASYSDGRRPDSIQFSSAEEDAQRRDFTINGLFYDPIAEQVIDYVDGETDLQARLIRAIGNPETRIHEDKLRMLRGVRFAATFDFALEPETAAAIARHAHELPIVSAERIAGEMRRMLTLPRRDQAVTLLAETQLLPVIVPEVAAILQSDRDHLPWQRTLAVLAALRGNRFESSLTALVRLAIQQSEEPVDIAAICERWRLSKHESSTLPWLLKQEAMILQADQADWPLLQKVLIDPRIDLLIELAEAVVATEPNPALRQQGESALRFCRERLAWPTERLNPAPLIDGHHLISEGFRPGKRFASLLETLRAAQLNGELTTPEEAIEEARRLWES